MVSRSVRVRAGQLRPRGRCRATADQGSQLFLLGAATTSPVSVTLIYRRQSRQRHNTLMAELMLDRALTPPRMVTPDRHHPSLDLRCHLMRTRQRLRRTISQTRQPVGCVLVQPRVQRLTSHPVTASDISDRRTMVQHLEHRLISLFTTLSSTDHQRDPLDRDEPTRSSPRRLTHTRRAKCQTATRVTVAQQPIASRNCHPPTVVTLSTTA